MNDQVPDIQVNGDNAKDRKFLFVACFVALVATSFAFIIRILMMNTWAVQFGLSSTEMGEIFGAGLWPFGISIVLFSLVIDRAGYRQSMVFAFGCHVASTIVLLTAKGYTGLYVGSVLNGLAAGTVEAVVNPVIASIYTKTKTKMLTILHAGWPGGMVLCGVVLLTMGGAATPAVKVGAILVPTLIYGVMMLRSKFPQNERVVAKVPYRDMLREAGALGALVVVYMISKELGKQFKLHDALVYGTIVAVTLGYLLYTRSLGRPMYIFLLLVMILLAITELGTDSWIKELRDPAMEELELDGAWIIVYTSTIMMVMRFCISPIVKVLKPLGVLLTSSLFAAAGLYLLSDAQGAKWILITATIYGIGQAFFWPVTLGIVSERFPRGGALTLNAIAGVGMLGVGIIGMPALGFIQDQYIDRSMTEQGRGDLYASLESAKEKSSVFGVYSAVDLGKVNVIVDKVTLYEYRAEAAEKSSLAQDSSDLTTILSEDKGYKGLVAATYEHVVPMEDRVKDRTHGLMHKVLAEKGFFVDKETYESLAIDKADWTKTSTAAKETAMASVAILPLIMAVCYLGLIFYFKSKGGYKAIDITADGKEAGEHAVTTKEAVADEEATPSE